MKSTGTSTESDEQLYENISPVKTRHLSAYTPLTVDEFIKSDYITPMVNIINTYRRYITKARYAGNIMSVSDIINYDIDEGNAYVRTELRDNILDSIYTSLEGEFPESPFKLIPCIYAVELKNKQDKFSRVVEEFIKYINALIDHINGYYTRPVYADRSISYIIESGKYNCGYRANCSILVEYINELIVSRYFSLVPCLNL